MSERDYRNFVIHINTETADGVYPVTVYVPAEDRRAEGAFSSPYTDAEVKRALSWMEQGLFDNAYVKEFGTKLFQALFVGDVKKVYEGSRQSSSVSLRLRLIIDTPSVACIPWELLYDPERKVFLALEGPFVRGFSLIEPTRPLKTKPPLRILVIDAFPQGVVKVQDQLEATGIKQALSGLIRSRQVEVEILSDATLRKLQDKLRESDEPANPRPFHVLHFIGHGQHDSVTHQTILLFHADHGQLDEVDAETLVNILRPYNLNLVFLNACQSMQSSALDLALGFAPALLESGVPCVIGMQITVLDKVAKQVSHDFYAALADNRPVDAALVDARQLVRGTRERHKADLGIPVCYLRTEEGRILDLGPPEKLTLTRNTFKVWLRERETLRKVIVGLATLVGLLSGLLALYRDPGIQQYLLGPGQMTCGDLNIAVAEFGVEDPQGRIVKSPNGRALAEAVSEFLTKELGPCTEMAAPSALDFKIQVWPPSKTGHISGTTPKDRAQEADKLAHKISADVIVYGNVQADTLETSFTPEFYLSERVVEGAAELAGQYEFGKVLTSTGSFDSPVTRKDLRTSLEVRAPALAQFVIGLSYFALDRFGEAYEHFEAAAATESWDDHDGKELIFLFLGHTAGQLDGLDSAEGYYRYILDELNPEYARARLGAAEILFQRARAGGCEPNKVDVDGLYNAIKGFKSALDAGDQPARSDITTKTAFLLSRAYLCLSQGLVADHWADAELESMRVIADFEGGNQRVKELAAEAHANLGFVYLPPEGYLDPEVNYHLAAEQYREAIELSRYPDRQAVFHLWLAWIHTRLAECELANESLANVDEAYSRSARSSPEYDAFRAAVKREISSCQLPEAEPSSNNWYLDLGTVMPDIVLEYAMYGDL